MMSARSDEFWDLFETILEEHVYPFRIKPSVVKQKSGELGTRGYATINKFTSECQMCLGVDFHTRCRDIRISIYFANIRYREYYDHLKENEDDIDEILDHIAVWNEWGINNPDARRVETVLPFESFNAASYRNVIEEALPIIEKYLAVCRTYLPEALDFGFDKVDYGD